MTVSGRGIMVSVPGLTESAVRRSYSYPSMMPLRCMCLHSWVQLSSCRSVKLVCTSTPPPIMQNSDQRSGSLSLMSRRTWDWRSPTTTFTGAFVIVTVALSVLVVWLSSPGYV